MPALQNWLNISPIDPGDLMDALRAAWRGLTSDQADPAEDRQLMGRGLERC